MHTDSLTRMARRMTRGVFTDEVAVFYVDRDWNEANGDYDETSVTVYLGTARIQTDQPYESTPDAGGHTFVTRRSELQVPIEATGITIGHRVAVTASRRDPELVGAEFRVANEHHESSASMRRIPIERGGPS